MLVHVTMFIIAAPSGAPETFTATLVLSTNVTVQWGRVSCSERNSEISYYTLCYSLVGKGRESHAGGVNVIGVGDRDRMYTVIKLHPQSIYTLTIAAVNTDEHIGPAKAINITTDTPESKKSDYDSHQRYKSFSYIQVLFFNYS